LIGELLADERSDQQQVGSSGTAPTITHATPVVATPQNGATASRVRDDRPRRDPTGDWLVVGGDLTTTYEYDSAEGMNDDVWTSPTQERHQTQAA
jgi:hypothetical protein